MSDRTSVHDDTPSGGAGRCVLETGIALVEVTEEDRAELERGLFTQGYSAQRAQNLAFSIDPNDAALQMLARHRMTASLRAWPDIGTNPMKRDERPDRHADAIKHVREAYVRQQQIVPDQTTLVWRWHIGALLEMAVRLQAILNRPDREDFSDARS